VIEPQPTPARFPCARILIFAKAPVPGQVKTRLIPTLGSAGAARLALHLLECLVQRLRVARPAPLELWCSPDPDHPVFQRLAKASGLALHRQRGDDLGERLHAATRDALTRADRVLLIGTDAPSLDDAYCVRALAALDHADCVMGPAEDGGYVLLGLKAPAPELFERMPWGSAEVGQITRQRAERLGWVCHALPALWDLDRPADLARYRRESVPV
jgi:rSAM/selenodomain-associated transferase 1